ncbi:DUF3472 domain-containing protein [Chitinophaga ginsengisoli]|nr:DUF3472 domain-containing protein [Chitinophaga ginsengisoli]
MMTSQLCSTVLFLAIMMFLSFNQPADWIKAGSEPRRYEMDTDRSIHHKGRSVMTIKSIETGIKGFGALMQTVDAGKYSGKRIRMTGYLKSKNVTGWSGFWLRINQANSAKPISIDNMQDRAIKGSVGWREYKIVLNVPDTASTITFGALLSGEGQIWFDENIQLEIVGSDVPITGINNSLNTISPLNIITQANLDSTRYLTKGDKRLNAPYLTLSYDLNNIDSVEWVYAEIKVPQGEAPLHTYYSVIGGNLFYSGIQTISKTERRIIFSVWDANSGDNDKEKVPDSARAVLLAAKKNIVYSRFGNEGSGVHTHYVYDWKEDSTYKFLIHAVPDSFKNSTTFTLFVDFDKHWEMIAKIRTPQSQGYPKYIHSFIEDFSTRDDEHRRSASFENVWVRKTNGAWKEITQAIFNLPFGDKNRKFKDYGCALSTSFGFMLSSGGGYTGTYIPVPALIKRNAKGIVPLKTMPE